MTSGQAWEVWAGVAGTPSLVGVGKKRRGARNETRVSGLGEWAGDGILTQEREHLRREHRSVAGCGWQEGGSVPFGPTDLGWPEVSIAMSLTGARACGKIALGNRRQPA